MIIFIIRLLITKKMKNKLYMHEEYRYINRDILCRVVKNLYMMYR